MANRVLDEWDIARTGLRSISAAEIKTFWNGYIARRKDARIEHGSLYSRWRRVADDLVLSLYLTNRSVGLFVRGQRGERFATTANRLSAYEPDLGLALDASLRGYEGCCYLSNLPHPVTDPASWPQAYAWLEEREQHYHRVLSEAVRRG
ncbi:hypothetical protein [Allomesorhizobium camelthorni]|uniref:Uncharacterized protein n=1 Tax=Allomesorhizobium camelthorni TaxID=475069 RepID=A0A6G4W6J0_9HYPH|nr:hypothetical protein [Mesorhizobium camelthorni]NGO50164.1 hypothetical protein [Mesorhizobium camelthorni]